MVWSVWGGGSLSIFVALQILYDLVQVINERNVSTSSISLSKMNPFKYIGKVGVRVLLHSMGD